MTTYNIKKLYDEIKLELGDRLQEYDGYQYICDVITEIADSNVHIYYSNLFDWVKYNWEYVDIAYNEFGIPSANGSNIIIELIQQAQFYRNEEILYSELDEAMLAYCYNYILNNFDFETITEEQKEEIENKCTNVDNNDTLEEFEDFIQELFTTEEEDEEEIKEDTRYCTYTNDTIYCNGICSQCHRNEEDEV